MYRLNIAGEVVLASTGATVPVSGGDPAWQAYRAWVAAGNRPAPYVPPAADVAARVASAQYQSDLSAARADARVQRIMSQSTADMQTWVGTAFPSLSLPERRELAAIVTALSVLWRRQ